MNATLTDLHGDDAAWYQLAMLTCREVPRSYSHQVVECKLKDQPTFTENLEQNNSLITTRSGSTSPSETTYKVGVVNNLYTDYTT